MDLNRHEVQIVAGALLDKIYTRSTNITAFRKSGDIKHTNMNMEMLSIEYKILARMLEHAGLTEFYNEELADIKLILGVK